MIASVRGDPGRQGSSTRLAASHNRLPSGCADRGKGGPKANPEGTRSALQATGAAGTLPRVGSGISRHPAWRRWPLPVRIQPALSPQNVQLRPSTTVDHKMA
jgi:hypothetical protein